MHKNTLYVVCMFIEIHIEQFIQTSGHTHTHTHTHDMTVKLTMGDPSQTLVTEQYIVLCHATLPRGIRLDGLPDDVTKEMLFVSPSPIYFTKMYWAQPMVCWLLFLLRVLTKKKKCSLQ